MSVERDIRFDLIARLCPNTTGAELRSVATEVCFSLACSRVPEPDLVLCRLECLQSVHGGRLLQNATSWTLWRRSFAKGPNSLARTYILFPCVFPSPDVHRLF